MEERWRKMGEGQKRWWQRGRDGSRRCLSKVKTLPWVREEHADPAVEVHAGVDFEKASSPMEKIEKGGPVGSDKAQIQKISPWHGLHIVVQCAWCATSDDHQHKLRRMRRRMILRKAPHPLHHQLSQV